MPGVNNHVAGENAVWIVMSLMAAIFYVPILVRALIYKNIFKAKSGQISPMLLACGIALVALGCIIHRGFWMVWRWMDAPIEWREISWVVTTPSIGLIVLGYSLHVYPYMSARWPRAWPYMIAVVSTFSYVISVWIGENY